MPRFLFSAQEQHPSRIEAEIRDYGRPVDYNRHAPMPVCGPDRSCQPTAREPDHTQGRALHARIRTAQVVERHTLLLPEWRPVPLEAPIEVERVGLFQRLFGGAR